MQLVARPPPISPRYFVCRPKPHLYFLSVFGVDSVPVDLGVDSVVVDAPVVDTAVDAPVVDTALDTASDLISPDSTADSVSPDSGVDTLSADTSVDSVSPDYSGGQIIDPTGIPISTGNWGHAELAVAWGGTSFLAVWGDQRAGASAPVIYGKRIDAAGVASGEVSLSSNAGAQTEPAIAFDGTNYLVTWAQDITTNGNIYARRVSQSGTVLGTSEFLVSSSGSTSAPDIAFDGTNFLVVWTQVGSGSDIYAARVSPAGVVLDSGGIAVASIPFDQFDPAVAWGGTQYFVTWTDLRTPTAGIYGTRIDANGALLDTAGGFAISATGERPAVAYNGAHFFVAWGDVSKGFLDADIRGARVDALGHVLDSPAIAIATGTTNDLSPAVDALASTVLLVWHRTGDGNLYGARVAQDGTLLDSSAFAVSTAVGAQDWPAIAHDDTQFFVAWNDARNGPFQIYGTRLIP